MKKNADIVTVTPKKLVAISDIHGRFDAFRKMINEKLLKDGYKAVFLGDYFGYGEQSIDVIRYIMYLKKKYPKQVFPLYGNWEEMVHLALFSENKAYRDDLIKIFYQRGWGNGFKAVQRNKGVVSIIKDFPNVLDVAYMEGTYCFVHAGVNVSLAKKKMPLRNVLAASSLQDLLWQSNFAANMTRVKTPFTYVVGHKPVQTFETKDHKIMPVTVGNVVGIDFGASRKKGFLGRIKFSEDGTRTFRKTAVM